MRYPPRKNMICVSFLDNWKANYVLEILTTSWDCETTPPPWLVKKMGVPPEESTSSFGQKSSVIMIIIIVIVVFIGEKFGVRFSPVLIHLLLFEFQQLFRKCLTRIILSRSWRSVLCSRNSLKLASNVEHCPNYLQFPFCSATKQMIS